MILGHIIFSKKIKDDWFYPLKNIDDAIIDLKNAFENGLLPNSLRMQNILILKQ